MSNPTRAAARTPQRLRELAEEWRKSAEWYAVSFAPAGQRMCEDTAVALDALANVRELVDQQAEDESLWRARFASTAYLQQELRKLHAAVESAALAAVRGRKEP